jgi:hypothetical protein
LYSQILAFAQINNLIQNQWKSISVSRQFQAKITVENLNFTQFAKAYHGSFEAQSVLGKLKLNGWNAVNVATGLNHGLFNGFLDMMFGILYPTEKVVVVKDTKNSQFSFTKQALDGAEQQFMITHVQGDVFQAEKDPNHPIDLIVGDMPYFVTTEECDSMEHFDSTCVDISSAVEMVVKLFMELAAEHAIGFIWCSSEEGYWFQQHIEPYNMARCELGYVHVTNAFSRKTNRGIDWLNNEMEHYVLITKGTANWINYGKDAEGKPIRHRSNFYECDFPRFIQGEPKLHPFKKPTDMMADVIKMYGKPSGNVIELFAGSCMAVEGCYKHGRNLWCIEKSKAFEAFFKQSLEKAVKKEKSSTELKFKNSDLVLEAIGKGMESHILQVEVWDKQGKVVTKSI